MRIRHLVLTESFAGVERHVCGLANEQVRQGHEVQVWGGRPSAMAQVLDPSVEHRPARRVVPALARGLASPTPDVLHAHMTGAETTAVTVGGLRNTPVVTTRHFAAPRGASLAGHAARPLIGRRVDAQIAISQYVAEHIDGPSTVVYPGVPSMAPSQDERRPVALVVQRLQPEKHTHIALQAFAGGAPGDWALEVVGSGCELTGLQALATDLGIAARTRFLGFREDVDELMRSSSVLLAPCPVEGLGLSVLEAMANGLPVVASRAGAHPETVGRAEDAHLFAADDTARAAEMLGTLCQDEDRRHRYGEQLRQVQRTTFTPQAQARATDAVYRQVTA